MKLRSLAALIGLILVSAFNRPSPAADSVPQRLTSLPIQQVSIDDAFWSPKFKTWRNVTVPDCFDKFEHDGVLANFDHIANGELTAPHGGAPWFDGLTYEMIQAVSDLLAEKPDPAVKTRLDGYIKRIGAAAARDPDGYLNTYTQLKEPTHRWGQNGGNDRWQHDLYNAGCLVDAAVHFYRATGDPTLLTTAVHMVNGMCKVMGPAPRKNIIPGHAVGEESLVGLYDLLKAEPALKDRLGVPVNADEYLALARFWIDARGHHEGRQSFGAYDQDAIPVLEQTTLEGHAVRATLMGAGLTAVGIASGEAQYLRAAERLWQNYTDRRMYITGGVGSFAADEKFGPDYMLPNACYAETCAAVGSAFFSHELNRANGDASTVDELERSLYNGALSGVSLVGNTYLYENPLESSFQHARWDWHNCPCCPPMFLKLMGALPSYIYATDQQLGVYVNLFVGSRANLQLGNATGSITQVTHYPWAGDTHLTIAPAHPQTFDLYIRIPAWVHGGSANAGLYKASTAVADAFAVRVNGQPAEPQIVRGYARLSRRWQAGDTVDVHMAMPIQRVVADARVEADRGRVALMRGPIVYCLESPDNGGHVTDLFLPDDAAITAENRADLLGGVTLLKTAGRRLLPGGGDASAPITAIPYYANANRGRAELAVWIPTTPATAVRPTVASLATPTASYSNPSDSLWAVSSGPEPKSSVDETRSRFTWWDHRGTSEWIQYEFDKPRTISGVDVYWWDETKVKRHCRVPQSWRLLYQKPDGSWERVPGRPEFGIQLDAFNKTRFEAVTTKALKIETQLQPNFSAGILQWRVLSTDEH